MLGKLTDDEPRVLIAGGTSNAKPALVDVTDNRVLSPPPASPA
ncbi:MAG: hypothetical protein WCC84_04015 [Candidatus Cybelea sp.]